MMMLPSVLPEVDEEPEEVWEEETRVHQSDFTVKDARNALNVIKSLFKKKKKFV